MDTDKKLCNFQFYILYLVPKPREFCAIKLQLTTSGFLKYTQINVLSFLTSDTTLKLFTL